MCVCVCVCVCVNVHVSMVCMYARMSYGVYSIYVISLSLFRMSECFERACFSLSPYPLHPPTYLTRTLSFSIWYTQNTMQEALCCTCLISSHTHACVFIPLSLPLTSTHISHSHTHACVWEKMRQLQHVCTGICTYILVSLLLVSLLLVSLLLVSLLLVSTDKRRCDNCSMCVRVCTYPKKLKTRLQLTQHATHHCSARDTSST